MTNEEFFERRNTLVRRIQTELHPLDCDFCGGMHKLRISRSDGEPIFDNVCCDDMIREVLRIRREVFSDLQG